ncbi:MAG: hypothetical protein KU38_13425 [Sulfurovum sp. FS08-3]|nr:MAG: hypothetical protein KU38_13425 [Sulfurovum sp. FS08-3]
MGYIIAYLGGANRLACKDNIKLYETDATKMSKLFNSKIKEADEVIRITNYTEDTTATTTNGHTGVLKDTIYLNYILSILAIE